MPARNGSWYGSNWIRRDKRLAIYLRDQFTCAYCNKNLVTVPAKQRTLDHVMPFARGGTNDTENLCVSCSRCNERKGDKTAWEFLRVRKHGAVRAERLRQLLVTPINRKLGKALLAGTLDLGDAITEMQYGIAAMQAAFALED